MGGKVGDFFDALELIGEEESHLVKFGFQAGNAIALSFESISD